MGFLKKLIKSRVLTKKKKGKKGMMFWQKFTVSLFSHE